MINASVKRKRYGGKPLARVGKHKLRVRRAQPLAEYTNEQMKADVDAGWEYFWSQPKRANLRPMVARHVAS